MASERVPPPLPSRKTNLNVPPPLPLPARGRDPRREEAAGGGLLPGVRRTGPLSPDEFFEALPIVLSPRLPVLLRTFDHLRGRGRLIKLDYGHPETHFEVWHHAGGGRLEVGLHFEGPPALNDAALDHFRARLVEIKHHLPRAELEPWDKGWSRLYETLPAATLSDELLDDAASLLALYLRTLQPMLETFWKEI